MNSLPQSEQELKKHLIGCLAVRDILAIDAMAQASQAKEIGTIGRPGNGDPKMSK